MVFGRVRVCVSMMVAEIQQCLAVSKRIYDSPWLKVCAVWACVYAIVTKTVFGSKCERVLQR